MATEQSAICINIVPETKVLAIASHVAYGYVGNTMATFVMQTLGCEVAAINTVNFSNHTGYGQFKGTRTSPEEIKALYEGLQQSNLTDFAMMLSGYTPSAAALQIVAQIARDLRQRSSSSPGEFFWILDPVMGDQGRLYVSEEMVSAYKEIVREADLILPNQFELEVLTGVKTGSGNNSSNSSSVGNTDDDDETSTLTEIAEAVSRIHTVYGIKHVVVTSVRAIERPNVLCVVGSPARSDGSSRLFVVEIPMLDCFFSGTGDMFAALMVGRFREACQAAAGSISPEILDQRSWMSGDDIEATELPLAKAVCKVLSSMQMVLEKTMVAMKREMEESSSRDTELKSLLPAGSSGGAQNELSESDAAKQKQKVFLARTKAAEVRVVRNARDLLHPEDRYRAEALQN